METTLPPASHNIISTGKHSLALRYEVYLRAAGGGGLKINGEIGGMRVEVRPHHLCHVSLTLFSDLYSQNFERWRERVVLQ